MGDKLLADDEQWINEQLFFEFKGGILWNQHQWCHEGLLALSVEYLRLLIYWASGRAKIPEPFTEPFSKIPNLDYFSHAINLPSCGEKGGGYQKLRVKQNPKIRKSA